MAGVTEDGTMRFTLGYGEVTAEAMDVFTEEDGPVTGARAVGGNGDSGGSGLSAEEATLPKIYMALGVLGILGNAFVILVIVNYKRMLKQVTNLYILNQSLIDGSCAVVLLFTYIFNDEGSKPMQGLRGEVICRVWVTTAPLWAMMTSSTANLQVVTIERYVAMTRPIWHKTSFTKKKALFTIPFIWLYGPLFQGIYSIASSGVIDGRCSVFSIWASDFARKVAGIYIFTLQFAGPLFVFCFCYGRMALILRKRKVAPAEGATGGQSANDKVFNNVIKMLFIVVAFYLFSWGFNEFYFLLFNLGLDYPYIDFTSTIYHFTVFMTFTNCCVNPFIYASKYRQFQAGVRHLFKIKDKRGVGDTNDAATGKTTGGGSA